MQENNANSSSPQNSTVAGLYTQVQTGGAQTAPTSSTGENPYAQGSNAGITPPADNQFAKTNNNVQNLSQNQAQQDYRRTIDAQSAQGQQLPPISFEMINILKSDCQKVDELVKMGKLQMEQGISLKLQLLKSAFDTDNNAGNPSATSNQTDGSPQAILNEYDKENGNFFEATDARKAVKSYIEESFDTLSKDELTNVAKMIETVENEAVSRFQTQMAREKSLDENNRLAKSRLGANSAMEKSPNAVSQKVFTRDEIGAMSIDEFKNNESEIFAQYRKGLIKK